MGDESTTPNEGQSQTTPPAEGQNTPPQDSPSRPEWLQEKFWDAKEGKANYESLATSYKELERTLKTRKDEQIELVKNEYADQIKENILKEYDSERLASRPESVDKYELKLPEEFMEQLPEGAEVQFIEDDPMLQFWKDTAFNAGMSQDDFSKGLSLYIQNQMSQFPDYDAEVKELGDYGKERAEHINNWVKNNFSQETHEALQNFAVTAKGVKALEELMVRSGEPRFSTDNLDGSSPTMNRAELESMMADPRYHDVNKRDPAFVKRVEDGFRKLYG